tara:strand:+ start:3138 stop:3416 length:279 start_codon:yes stop_codon:yes gene_type:complete
MNQLQNEEKKKKENNIPPINDQIIKLFIDIGGGDIEKLNALLSNLVEPIRKKNGVERHPPLIASRDTNTDMKGRIFKFKLDTSPLMMIWKII